MLRIKRTSSDELDWEVKEKLKPFEDWKKAFEEKWKYNQTLVVFEDAQGNVITPSTTTTTTTTTTQKPIITSEENGDKHTHPSKFTSVVTIESTTGPRTDRVVSADTTELIKIVGITCGTLIGIILLILFVIRLCRKSAAKRRQRVTVRRPLTEADREEHIYAEIEPLQRTPSPGGASGTSADVQLPKKKDRKRRGGISSFRALSTRIYRFFNVDSDSQSVFYNRTSERATVSEERLPELPGRNTMNGKRARRVNRGESTASRRPLIDGDSRTDDSRVSVSSTAEMRDNVYNPLLKDSENGRAPSGPYDHLALIRSQSGNTGLSKGEPSSPHDYFTLEKNGTNRNPEEGIEGDSVESSVAPTDLVKIENETHRGIDTIAEEVEVTPTPQKHDYFVLEPHERIRDDLTTEDIGNAKKLSTKSKDVDKPAVPVEKEATVSDKKTKPEVTPRVTKLDNERSPETKTDPESLETSSPYEVAKDIDAEHRTEDIKRSDSKEETYVLSKFGDAPQPPASVNDDEYLKPTDVKKKADYVDVFPNPPPRTSSLQPHELSSHTEQIHEKNKHSHVHGKSSKDLPVHSDDHKTENSSVTVSPKSVSKVTKTSPKKTSANKGTKSPLSSPKKESVSPVEPNSEKHSPTHTGMSSPKHKPSTPDHKPVSPIKMKVETDI